MSFKNIAFEVKEKFYYVGFGKDVEKSLTTLTEQTLRDLETILDTIKADNEARGVIFHSLKEGVFLAGVDVSIIQSLETAAAAAEGSASGQALFNKIEDLDIPTVALIDGFCLGGGLELALSCNKIIVSDSSTTKLGLPEVMLGVLPGFGGTYRLPKKIGMAKSLDIILSGRQVRAKSAYKMGLADFIMPKERLLTLAPEYLLKKVEPRKKNMTDKVTSFMESNPLTKGIIFSKARDGVMKKTKGHYPAPLKIIELLENHSSKSRSAYLEKEASFFGELAQTKQSEHLINLFFLHDNSKKYSKSTDLKNVSTGAVLGAGTMGGGIAWYFANNNIPCFMKDINEGALNLGLKQASSNFSSKLRKRRMTRDDFNKKMSSISPTLTYSGFHSVDLVIEAVVENMDIKKKVLSELETKVGPDSLLTSNTSSLSVNEMASVLKDSSRFAGLHFFNPVNKMPLVEIIKHENVSQNTLDSLYKFVVETKKTPVIVNDGPGFLVNRILCAYLNEAGFMLEEGYSIEDLDRVVLEFGLPMGPCHLLDEVGIDVSQKVGKVMYKGIGDRLKPSKILDEILELGCLGKKNSKGIYLYDEAGKKGEINPEVRGLLPSQTKSSSDIAMTERLIFPMINEAANCLKDQVVDSAANLDLAMIFGIGFPPFKGGLLRYADDIGADQICEKIRNMSAELSSDRFALSPYLSELSKQGKSFYS